MPRSLMTMVTWCSASGSGSRNPSCSGAPQIRARVAFVGVDQVGELQRVAHEEDRRVVAHQVPVALLGVELDGEAPDVPLGVGRAALAGHGGEPDEEVGLFAHRREELRLGAARDVVGDREGAVGPGALGVHAPLGDDLPVEVRQLLEHPHPP